MESKFCFVFLLIFCTSVQSASIWETSFDYLMNMGKNLGPSFWSMFECVGTSEPWGCAREKAGKMLDGWGEDVEKERRIWEQEADAAVRASGRSISEMPSKLGKEIIDSVGSLANVLERGMARAFEAKKHQSEGGIDSITISTGGGDKKKMKKKKPKPPKIHLIRPMVLKAQKEEKGRNFGSGVQSWVIGERSLPVFNSTQTVEGIPDTPLAEGRSLSDAENDSSPLDSDSNPVVADSTPDSSVSNPENKGVLAGLWEMGQSALGIDPDSISNPVAEGKGIFTEMWDMGQNVLDSLADTAIEEEDKENGIQEKNSVAVSAQGGYGTSTYNTVDMNNGPYVVSSSSSHLQGGFIHTGYPHYYNKQRGKKKKKKKAILKLLVLGAVIKAKIATLLQILNYKLQMKFLILAMLNFIVNIGSLWFEYTRTYNLNTTTTVAPQIIYYEHAQHQHHYDHEEEESHGWGPWSRSIFPADDSEAEVSDDPSPYKAQERSPLIYNRPYPSRV